IGTGRGCRITAGAITSGCRGRWVCPENEGDFRVQGTLGWAWVRQRRGQKAKTRNQKPEIRMNDQNQSSTLTSMSSVESRLRPEGKPKIDELTPHWGFGFGVSFGFLVVPHDVGIHLWAF